MIAVEETHNQSFGFEIGIDITDLVVDFGGFGDDGAAGAPEAKGDFTNEVFLEDGLRLEFGVEFFEEGLEFGGVLFEAGGIDEDMAGMETVFDGVSGGDGFTLIGFGPGGFLGILPVGGDLFFRRRHSYILFEKKRSSIRAPGDPINSELMRFL
ncbi:MAG: hypothetical protein CVT49_07220 [candidate division Zixibacteria bacterium HGW-Zixibacteria-1]|nr:MAG: hypothetical protein CVT49_07220 [candidate division Zixibacteria bacterium HGW-Zixibacteria-1]